jgi:hypothetical protein
MYKRMKRTTIISILFECELRRGKVNIRVIFSNDAISKIEGTISFVSFYFNFKPNTSLNHQRGLNYFYMDMEELVHLHRR